MSEERNYRGFRDLKVYQLSYQLALEIFKMTKTFPNALVDQMRRSSRSVSTNIAEAWYKRRYPKSFISKLVDSAGEAGETGVWIDFSWDHGYLEKNLRDDLSGKYNEVGKMLSGIMAQPEKFCY